MLSFPLILTGVLAAAGVLLAVILLVVLLPRRGQTDSTRLADEQAPLPSLNGRNGEGFRR